MMDREPIPKNDPFAIDKYISDTIGLSGEPYNHKFHFINQLANNEKFHNYVNNRWMTGDNLSKEHMKPLAYLSVMSQGSPEHANMLNSNIPINNVVNNFSRLNTIKHGIVIPSHHPSTGIRGISSSPEVYEHIPHFLHGRSGGWQWRPMARSEGDQQNIGSMNSVTGKPLTGEEMISAGIDPKQASLQHHIVNNLDDITAQHALADMLEDKGDTETAAKIRRKLGYNYIREMQDSWYLSYYSKVGYGKSK